MIILPIKCILGLWMIPLSLNHKPQKHMQTFFINTKFMFFFSFFAELCIVYIEISKHNYMLSTDI